MHKSGRIVYRQADGKWINKSYNENRESTTHGTLLKAMDAARRMLRNEGGGQLTIKGEDGSIKDISMIPPHTDNYRSRSK